MAKLTVFTPRSRRKDITGKRFCRWKVISYSHTVFYSRHSAIAVWNCRCDCGAKRAVRGDFLVAGRSRSCGCLRVDNLIKHNTTHGLSKGKNRHKLYGVWLGMRSRCTNPKHNGFEYYGGRGIKVCLRWDNFALFFRDMLPSYRHGLTLDRKDRNGNYEPKNCRWATWKEQAANKAPRKDSRSLRRISPEQGR